MARITVVVESPSKAKTIQSYLGKGYNVIASIGHVRSLPSKPGSVIPERNFEMIFENNSDKQVQELVKKSSGSSAIYLATDPDREGEAISFHVKEILKEHGVITDAISAQRIVFNSITKSSINDAISKPRQINLDLVKAQQARQSLDYLVGFTLSPLLWYKLPSSKSAGRVQSVLLRLICEREDEILDFKSQEFWTINALFFAKNGKFTAELTHLNGERVEQFYCPNEEISKSIIKELQTRTFVVETITRKQVKRAPKPPFITSTLQQEASSKLRFNTKKTMSVAQKLYEGVQVGDEILGLITYMRTDGVYIDEGALKNIRGQIKKSFGEEYLAPQLRLYKSKTVNAQEAHEAIRPTNISLDPKSLAPYLSEEQLKLYTLIWNRTMASQMADALFDQVSVAVGTEDKYATFTETSSVLKFDGFYCLDPQSDKPSSLPELESSEPLKLEEILDEQHFTQPPPRYSEAGLVKRMEELGIGRPSTYASIISVIQERGYVKNENRSFVPEMSGKILTLFLKNFFEKYVEYNFTAQLEEELDAISLGKLGYVEMLSSFWQPFIQKIEEVKKVTRSDILKTLESRIIEYVFPVDETGKRIVSCPKCKIGQLAIHLGKFGLFTQCDRKDECDYTGNARGEASSANISLVTHPESDEEILLKNGPYGPYLQMGSKRISLPKKIDPSEITPDYAINLMKLPYSIGNSPSDGKDISIGIGIYGPYAKHDGKYISVRNLQTLFSLDALKAYELIQAKALREKKKATKK